MMNGLKIISENNYLFSPRFLTPPSSFLVYFAIQKASPDAEQIGTKSCAAGEIHLPALCSLWKQTSNVFLVWACMCWMWAEGWDVWLECWRGTEWRVWTGKVGRGNMSFVTSPTREGSAQASCRVQRWSFLPAVCGLIHLVTNIWTILQVFLFLSSFA